VPFSFPHIQILEEAPELRNKNLENILLISALSTHILKLMTLKSSLLTITFKFIRGRGRIFCEGIGKTI
jgi:hypothetical protein